MKKLTTSYACQACGAVHRKWVGKCEACGEWNTLAEEAQAEVTPKGLTAGKGKAIALTGLVPEGPPESRTLIGIGELDRVLGGGLVPGSATLIGGDPGIGKSTLLLQAAAALARGGASVAYISGEESVAQVQLRAARLGVSDAAVTLASATSVRDIVTTLDHRDGPDIAILDSVQTLYLDSLDSAPGTVGQVRASAHEIIKLAKRRKMAVFLVGHVTKDGQIAGPRVLEHMVDTVLYFEGERGVPFRILRSVKNRFGGTDEIGVFDMGEQGLTEVTNPSALFLAGRSAGTSGSAVFAGMEGTRPVLMEIQALVAPSGLAMPRRAVVGWDSARLAMILAVLETRAGVRFGDKEVYLNVAGGLKINEPAADLPVAAALLSSLTDEPLPENAVFFGEIGLSGEIRQVGRGDARLKESEKLGFGAAWIAERQPCKQASLAIQPLQHVRELAGRFGTDAPRATHKDRPHSQNPRSQSPHSQSYGRDPVEHF